MTSPQTPAPMFQPTPEQTAICGASGRIVKANAFAGTGKSSTLKHLARTWPQSKMLYIAFNKAIKDEAVKSFPGNVKAMTGHGLAYASKGRLYGGAGQKLQGDIKPFHIKDLLVKSGSLKSVPADAENLYAGRVIETVKNFLVSRHEELSPRHVVLGGSPAEREMSPTAILEDAKRVWAEMQEINSPIPMLHDGYFKLYQLSRPRLPYDFVLVDEAQDVNPTLQAIIEAQEQTRIFLIGDTHQAIYSFRGANNAMELMRADQAFGLTGSFRFGPAVAEVANQLLSIKGESLTLRGLGAPTELREIDTEKEGFALVSRGNASLFHQAVQALDQDRPFAFVGPLGNYRLDLFLDTYRLMSGDKRGVRDPFIKSFTQFDDLANYGEAMDDREVKGRVKLVTQYSGRIPELIDAITAKSIPWGEQGACDLPPNCVVLSTAHKSKGLEFPNVVLADDYMSLLDDEDNVISIGDMSESDVEEVNLQYVAATRAQKALQLSEGLDAFLEAKRVMDETSRPRMAAG